MDEEKKTCLYTVEAGGGDPPPQNIAPPRTPQGDVVPVRELSYKTRRAIALKAADYFCENASLSGAELVRGFKEAHKELYELNLERFRPTVESFGDVPDTQKTNVWLACLLFYILSAGGYPDAFWRSACQKKDETVFFRLKKLSAAYIDVCSDAAAAEKHLKNELLILKRADIDPLLSANGEVGEVKLYEMLWDVFVKKIGNNSPPLWKKKLEEFAGKEFNTRRDCEFKEAREKIEIYAVSYEGKLDKPMHDECEDCSFVTFYGDDYTFLAVSSDGVGSCANSGEGSLLATEYLSEVISGYLSSKGFLNGEEKTEEEWASLAYYLTFNLAADFYAVWEEAVKRSEKYGADRGAGSFAATLQFAFGCRKFIACGRLGDGTFYVKKRDGGGFILNDGFSGVTQSAVLTVPHLKDNPAALKVSIFGADGISDIIISSDGVSGELGGDIAGLEKFAGKADGLTFAARCDFLSRTAKICSDYNETHHGSGDDCTLVHVRIKN